MECDFLGSPIPSSWKLVMLTPAGSISAWGWPHIVMAVFPPGKRVIQGMLLRAQVDPHQKTSDGALGYRWDGCRAGGACYDEGSALATLVAESAEAARNF